MPSSLKKIGVACPVKANFPLSLRERAGVRGLFLNLTEMKSLSSPRKMKMRRMCRR
jgi:hypothetical protein